MRCLFKGNNVTYSSFHTNGIPYIMVARGGKCSLGRNFRMNNGIKGNPIGCYERCTFFVDRGAVLTIGETMWGFRRLHWFATGALPSGMM